MGKSEMNKTVTLAITGASGAQYAFKLLSYLIQSKIKVYLLISRAAEAVIKTETDYSVPSELDAQKQWFYDQFPCESGQLTLFGREDWFAPVASGSGAPDAMVIWRG